MMFRLMVPINEIISLALSVSNSKTLAWEQYAGETRLKFFEQDMRGYHKGHSVNVYELL